MAAMSNLKISEKLLINSDTTIKNTKNKRLILRVLVQKIVVLILSEKFIILIFDCYDVYRDRALFLDLIFYQKRLVN